MKLLKATAVLLVALGAAAALALKLNCAPSLADAVKREVPTVDAATRQAKARVVLITLDGARWQDVLDPEGPLKQTLAAARSNGLVLRGETSSQVPLSLPGFQAIALGKQTACEDNACPRVTEPTVAEVIAERLKLPPEQVALFGSWARLVRAFAAKDGAVHVDLPPEGPNPGVPWPNARLDAETADRALAHWAKHRPRFMHLALLDMDEWAHAQEREKMVGALAAADATIARVRAEVARLPEEERRLTTVLVTTDHGRGLGPMWFDHGPFEAARTIWLLAIGDQVGGDRTTFTQAELRPMIEAALGLR